MCSPGTAPEGCPQDLNMYMKSHKMCVHNMKQIKPSN